MSASANHYDAIIVGAGFSGLYQLHSLRDRLGLKVRVLEAGDGVGGTWYWNRYPGARCDSESYYYSFSFSKELEQEWEWTEKYPQQPEIMRYLNHVADRFDLKRDIQFATRVTSARFDEAANLWHIACDSGESFSATYFITAVGCLSSTNLPQLPGLENFAGEWYHTGAWPQDGVDFSGKHVGLVGTGSTGIQATPVLAAEAAHLTVFQRTANYSIPARNGPLAPDFRTWVKENYAEIRTLSRETTNGHPFRISSTCALDVTAEDREKMFEAAWQEGGLKFRATFHDILVDKAANDTAADFIRRKIAEIVQDPDTARKLAPLDHPFATKRPPIDTGYFETFNRDNVDLVDIRATPITAVTPTGVQTADAEYPLDVIVFATGFDAMTGPLLKMHIEGRDGLKLSDAWAAGPRTYLGLQVAGFPNMFTITGPGSPSVLCNMPIAIEQHVEWIERTIAYMRDHGITRMEARADAADKWVDHVNDAAHATLLPLANSSWYLGANVPGKPRVFMPYAGGMNRYRDTCEAVIAQGYEGFVLSSGTQKPPISYAGTPRPAS